MGKETFHEQFARLASVSCAGSTWKLASTGNVNRYVREYWNLPASCWGRQCQCRCAHGDPCAWPSLLGEHRGTAASRGKTSWSKAGPARVPQTYVDFPKLNQQGWPSATPVNPRFCRRPVKPTVTFGTNNRQKYLACCVGNISGLGLACTFR